MSKSNDESEAVLDYKGLKSKKKPVVKTVPIVMDSVLADEFNTINERVNLLKRRLDINPKDQDAKRELVDLEAELERLTEANLDNIVEFTFKSIGRKGFEEILEEYPATAAQKRDAKREGNEEPGFDIDTFPPALLAAALVSPSLTADDIADMWDSDDWNHAELMVLFLSAMEVNQQRKIIDIKKGSGLTRD